MFGLEIPDWRVRLIKGRRRVVLPYFNAGVVGFVEKGNPAGMRFPDVWFDTATKIDANPLIGGKRPWLDQISLPVAAARMGGRVEVLSDLDNFSPYRLNSQAKLNDVRLFHYRMPAFYRNMTNANGIQNVCSHAHQSILDRGSADVLACF